ncbi:MAG: sigma 54-dependent Fis family transcriptional regulator [Deltaproteobacteria bacterium]|nr:sigma 54-dependent Fis family transcriptional regulator [Deltaproteobacteria bacterium]
MSDERTHEHRAGTGVPVRRVVAHVVRGPEAATASGERIVVGSARDCDLVVGDRTVSRYHAELEAAHGGIRVRDLGSTNGLAIGGVRVTAAIVPCGAVIELGAAAVRVEDAEVATETSSRAESLGDLTARAPTTRRLVARIEKAAASDASIVITGEPGTGKELVARTLHATSGRAGGPFVVVDCGALAGPLVASELFGHERGAFTDADERRTGAFERAHGGTLVLDDVTELPPDVQPMLLGALERRAARRVGGRDEVAFDVRVIAIASRDLRAEVNAGRFRLDLYYRIAVVKLDVPALRDRIDDLPILVARFLEERGEGVAHALLAEERVAELVARDWPGNVRELRNVVEAALAMGEIEPGAGSEPVGEGDASAASTEALIESLLDVPYKDARQRFSRALEHAYCSDLARRARGVTSVAARLAGLDRSQLRQLLARAGVAIRA